MTLVKFFLGALGAIALGIGATLIAVAVGLLTWVGMGDTVVVPEIQLATSDGTVLAEEIDFLFEEARFVPDLGSASLHIRSTDGRPVFAGVTDRLTAQRFLGDGIDAASQTFWLTADHGPVADLVWDIRPGEWIFVVAGTDGSVPTDIVIEGELGASPFRVAAGKVAGIGLGAGVAGALLLVAAFGLGRAPRGASVGTGRMFVPAAG